MTYAIWNGKMVVQMTRTELAMLFGKDDAESMLDGWTIKGCWRVY